MNPNQPHPTGQYPNPAPNQWQQTPPTPTVGQNKGLPAIGAYGLGAIGVILGVVALIISLTSGGNATSTTANGVDQATADKRMCAAAQSANNVTAAAGASWASASTNKAQLSDAIAGYGTAIAVVLVASEGTSPDVQSAATNWIETVQKAMAATTTAADLDAAAGRLKSAACK